MQLSVDAFTRYVDKSDEDIRYFSLADIHTGDWLDLQVTQYGDAVTVSRIERQNTQDNVKISGTVTRIESNDIVVMGIQIASDELDNNNLSDAIGQIAFAAGNWTGAVIEADHLSLRDPDITDDFDREHDFDGWGRGHDPRRHHDDDRRDDDRNDHGDQKPFFR